MSGDPTRAPGGEVVYERLTAQNSELRRRVDELERELDNAADRFSWLQEIGATLADFGHPDEIVADMLERIPHAMDAERAALFLMEDDDVHLYTRVAVDGMMREIRLARGEGLAGWVVDHGRAVNVKDAYRDPRFLPRYDEMHGFRTRSVLCHPMRNKDGRIVGVLQVLNRRSGWFGVADEKMLASIANVVVIVLENKRLFLQTVDRNMELEQTQRQLEDRMRRIDTLYDLQRRINEADDLEQVVEAIALGTITAVPSHAVAITLVEGSAGLPAPRTTTRCHAAGMPRRATMCSSAARPSSATASAVRSPSPRTTRTSTRPSRCTRSVRRRCSSTTSASV